MPAAGHFAHLYSARTGGSDDEDDLGEAYPVFTPAPPSAAVSQAQMDSLLDQIEALERSVRRSQRPADLPATGDKPLARTTSNLQREADEEDPVSESFTSAQQRVHGGAAHPLVALQAQVKAMEDQGRRLKQDLPQSYST